MAPCFSTSIHGSQAVSWGGRNAACNLQYSHALCKYEAFNFLQVEEGNSVLDTSAVQFCARKVSAMAGDMRKALDIAKFAAKGKFHSLARKIFLVFVTSWKQEGFSA